MRLNKQKFVPANLALCALINGEQLQKIGANVLCAGSTLKAVSYITQNYTVW